MLAVQERITRRQLQVAAGGTVLDVGGGHGQLAVPLCRDGWRVTVLGSAESCRHRVREVVDSGACEFVVGNVLAPLAGVAGGALWPPHTVCGRVARCAARRDLCRH